MSLLQLTYKGNKFANLDTKIQERVEWLNYPKAEIKGNVVTLFRCDKSLLLAPKKDSLRGASYQYPEHNFVSKNRI